MSTDSSTQNGLSILLTVDHLPPSGGGTETVVKNLAEELAERGHIVTIFSLSEGKKGRNNIDSTVSVVTTPSADLTSIIGLQSRVSVTGLTRFRKLLRSKEPDIIHSHNRFFFSTLVSTLYRVAHPSNTSLVFTAHVGSINNVGGISGRVANVYEQTVARQVLRKSDAVISVSKSVADHVLERGGDDIHVIPNGVDTTTFFPAPNEKRHHPPTVLFVGRLVRNKGPRVLIEALPNVFESVPGATAEIVGPGDMRKPLEERCQDLGIGNRVTFHGYVEHVEEIMRQSSVFCLPSFGEGLPLTLLEAMASGIPTVTTGVGGMLDVVDEENTGLLVPPGDPTAVGEAVTELLSDPDRRIRMGSQARKYVVENHSWESRTKDVLSVYRSLLK